MLKALSSYIWPQSEDVIIYIDWIGRSSHHATIKSLGKNAYFMNKPHGRKYDPNEIVFGYIFDDIFKYIKEGRTYKCKVINEKIVEIIQIK